MAIGKCIFMPCAVSHQHWISYSLNGAYSKKSKRSQCASWLLLQKYSFSIFPWMKFTLPQNTSHQTDLVSLGLQKLCTGVVWRVSRRVCHRKWIKSPSSMYMSDSKFFLAENPLSLKIWKWLSFNIILNQSSWHLLFLAYRDLLATITKIFVVIAEHE